MGKRFCGPFGAGALLVTFLLGLIFAVFLPWLAILLLCAAVALAILMLIQLPR